MTITEERDLLRAALESIMPIAEQNGPAPYEMKEWAYRVIGAKDALRRTQPLSQVEGAALLGNIITRTP